MYPGLGSPPDTDRTVTWRSIIAAYTLLAGVFVGMVAVSYPGVALAVIATGTAIYVLHRVVRAAAREERVCIPRTQICLPITHRYR